MTRIFIDFDGTITRRDVGDALFEKFGGAAAALAVNDYRQGSIAAVECFRRECDACGAVEKSSIGAFLDAEQIDDTFEPFVRYCREAGFDCTILSDGMDYYIGRILERYGLGDVRFYANSLELVPAGSLVRLQPTFPHTDEV